MSKFPIEFKLFEPFWQGVKTGVLQFPYCQQCNCFHWYPMPRCPHCRHSEAEETLCWRQINGRGQIFTWTVVHHRFSEDVQELPYIVALLEFGDAPGIRLVTNIINSDIAELAIGARVEPVFAGFEGDQPLLKFQLVR